MEDTNPNPASSLELAEDETTSAYIAKVVKLLPENYEFPESISPENFPLTKPIVRIKIAMFIEQVRSGLTWEELSDFYTVDIGTLKRHLSVQYNKARAELKTTIMTQILQVASEGNPVLLKFLGSSVLQLHEKVQAMPVEEVKPSSITDIDSKLEKLLKKHGPKKETK